MEVNEKGDKMLYKKKQREKIEKHLPKGQRNSKADSIEQGKLNNNKIKIKKKDKNMKN